MSMDAKFFPSLQVSDLEKHPVWETIVDYEADEGSVFPVTELPAVDLTLRLVGTPVRLANGQSVWAILSHLDTEDPRKSEQFLALRVEKDGNWWDLARYWDPYYESSGPEALAHMIEIMAAKGLAEIGDKDSIPFIIEACKKAPTEAASVIAESLVYFDDNSAQSAVDRFIPQDQAKIYRDAKAHGRMPLSSILYDKLPDQ